MSSQHYTVTIRFDSKEVDMKLVTASSSFEAGEIVKGKLAKEGRTTPADLEVRVFNPMVEG